LSICTTRAEGRSDCGTIQLDTDSRILRFSEKAVLSGTPYVNAGIYLFSQEALALIPSGKKASLEYELFPSLAGKAIFGYYCDGGVIDIGTPERYQTAQKRLQTNKGEFI